MCRARFRATTNGFHGKITFADISQDFRGQEHIARVTLDALDLIERHDLRRYRIVERETDTIANTEAPAVIRYRRQFRTCLVYLPAFHLDPDGDDYVWHLACYAGAPVHEATRGRLLERGRRTDRDSRLRVERICRAEMERFLRRVKSERYDFAAIRVPLDEAYYRKHVWGVRRWKQLGVTLKRLWDGYRADRKSSSSGSGEVDR